MRYRLSRFSRTHLPVARTVVRVKLRPDTRTAAPFLFELYNLSGSLLQRISAKFCWRCGREWGVSSESSSRYLSTQRFQLKEPASAPRVSLRLYSMLFSYSFLFMSNPSHSFRYVSESALVPLAKWKSKGRARFDSFTYTYINIGFGKILNISDAENRSFGKIPRASVASYSPGSTFFIRARQMYLCSNDISVYFRLACKEKDSWLVRSVMRVYPHL